MSNNKKIDIFEHKWAFGGFILGLLSCVMTILFLFIVVTIYKSINKEWSFEDDESNIRLTLFFISYLFGICLVLAGLFFAYREGVKDYLKPFEDKNKGEKINTFLWGQAKKLFLAATGMLGLLSFISYIFVQCNADPSLILFVTLFVVSVIGVVPAYEAGKEKIRKCIEEAQPI